MFRRIGKTIIQRRQSIDNDDVIESKIKECQRKNGRCMVSTSSRLRQTYGDDKENLVLKTLSARRCRGNK
jgi:hypothetical protein